MSSLSVAHRIFEVPRAGSDEAEYEDAAAVAVEEGPVCAAVADGATESVFARRWARHLVRGLVEQRATTTEAFRGAVPDWQAEWHSTVRDRTEEQPWYVAAKAAKGAFAALLGLSLHADGQWRAVSVGDCCLFQVRSGALARSWPFQTPGAFTNHPALVSSRADRAVPPPEAACGTWQPQDIFLLATDAVAAWLLDTDLLRDTRPQIHLRDAVNWNEGTFQNIVETARDEGALRNDDATLLVVHVEPEAGANEEAAAM